MPERFGGPVTRENAKLYAERLRREGSQWHEGLTRALVDDERALLIAERLSRSGAALGRWHAGLIYVLLGKPVEARKVASWFSGFRSSASWWLAGTLFALAKDKNNAVMCANKLIDFEEHLKSSTTQAAIASSMSHFSTGNRTRDYEAAVQSLKENWPDPLREWKAGIIRAMAGDKKGALDIAARLSKGGGFSKHWDAAFIRLLTGKAKEKKQALKSAAELSKAEGKSYLHHGGAGIMRALLQSSLADESVSNLRKSDNYHWGQLYTLAIQALKGDSNDAMNLVDRHLRNGTFTHVRSDELRMLVLATHFTKNTEHALLPVAYLVHLISPY